MCSSEPETVPEPETPVTVPEPGTPESMNLEEKLSQLNRMYYQHFYMLFNAFPYTSPNPSLGMWIVLFQNVYEIHKIIKLRKYSTATSPTGWVISS